MDQIQNKLNQLVSKSDHDSEAVKSVNDAIMEKAASIDFSVEERIKEANSEPNEEQEQEEGGSE